MKKFLLISFFFVICNNSANADYVSADVLNVRTSPGTEHSVVAKLKKNKYVEVVASDKDWVNINWYDENSKKKSGWVYKKYLVKNMLQSNKPNSINSRPYLRTSNYVRDVFEIYDYKFDCANDYVMGGLASCDLKISLNYRGSNSKTMSGVECSADLDYLEVDRYGSFVHTTKMRGYDFIYKNSYFNEVKLSHRFTFLYPVAKAAVRNIECRLSY